MDPQSSTLPSELSAIDLKIIVTKYSITNFAYKIIYFEPDLREHSKMTSSSLGTEGVYSLASIFNFA